MHIRNSAQKKKSDLVTGEEMAQLVANTFAEETRDMTPAERSEFLQGKLSELKQIVEQTADGKKKSRRKQMAEVLKKLQEWKES